MLHCQILPITTVLAIHIQQVHLHLLESHILPEVSSHIVVVEDVEVVVFSLIHPFTLHPFDPNSTDTY